MPAFIAFPTGVVNEVELVSVVAIPAALADTAVLIAETISESTEFAEPVHFGAGRPNSAAASAIPYWVGVKKLFVVTWLTNQYCHFGVLGNGLLPTRLPLPSAAARRAAGGEQRRRGARRADQPGAGEQSAPGRAVLHVEGLYCLVDLRMNLAHPDLRLSRALRCTIAGEANVPG